MALDPARLQAIGLDPGFSDPAPFGPPRPADLPQQSTQLSVLDMLRKRMARDMEGEALQRVGEFGQGMLASGSPNFFTMLGAGARAAREGDVSRMDRLRQLAEAERQERSLEGQEAARRAEEAYRQESLRLRREEAARAGRPQYTFLRDATSGEVVAVDPRDPTRRVAVPGVMLATDRTAQQETVLRQNAARTARADVVRREQARVAAGARPLTTQQLDEEVRLAERDILASIGLSPLTGAGTSQQQQPAPGGRPVVREGYVPPEQRR